MNFAIKTLKRIFGPKKREPQKTPSPRGAPPPTISRPSGTEPNGLVRRHFHNEAGFQTYGTYFRAWNGWITAGHVQDECMDHLPPFASGPVLKWPAGLDAAILGCALPDTSPLDPVPGQLVRCIGYPAGSEHPATREAKIYIKRPQAPDTWIAHILKPDEPVVTGMSGGIVLDASSGAPVGIIITRNSPADLNADRDPDESFDFVSLAGVWRALSGKQAIV